MLEPAQLHAGVAGLQVGAGIVKETAVKAGAAEQFAHQLAAAGVAPQNTRPDRFAFGVAEPHPFALPGEADGA